MPYMENIYDQIITSFLLKYYHSKPTELGGIEVLYRPFNDNHTAKVILPIIDNNKLWCAPLEIPNFRTVFHTVYSTHMLLKYLLVGVCNTLVFAV